MTDFLFELGVKFVVFIVGLILGIVLYPIVFGPLIGALT